MEEIKIQKEWITEAKKRSLDLGRLKNSIEKGRGNVAGFLGEIATLYLLGKDPFCTEYNTFDYDLMVGDKTVEVKTKRCQSKPRNYYECSVASTSIHQRCTHYVFTRIDNDYKFCWVLGWMTKEDYLKQSKFLKKGDKDGDNGFIASRDCYNVPISKLNSMKNFS